MEGLPRKIYTSRNYIRSYFDQLVTGKINSKIFNNSKGPISFVISIANHFEPKVRIRGMKEAVESIKKWCCDMEKNSTRDFDGHPFKHTYYFPAEQYVPELLYPIEKLCKKGFGEVEVHLHHGKEQPDNPENLRKQLEEFVRKLQSHGFLSYDVKDMQMRPRYCFVHGNWALANSALGKFCGVDNEMQILAETGCYMDCTMPSAPDITQVKKNQFHL